MEPWGDVKRQFCSGYPYLVATSPMPALRPPGVCAEVPRSEHKALGGEGEDPSAPLLSDPRARPHASPQSQHREADLPYVHGQHQLHRLPSRQLSVAGNQTSPSDGCHSLASVAFCHMSLPRSVTYGTEVRPWPCVRLRVSGQAATSSVAMRKTGRVFGNVKAARRQRTA